MSADGDRKRLSWETLEYVARYLIYPLIILLFFMWSDLRGASQKQNDKIQQLQMSMAVNQAQNQLLVKMMEKVDKLEGRLTRSETILEMHRDDMKKYTLDKK